VNEITNIIRQLEQQQAAIQRALSALREIGGGGTVATTKAVTKSTGPRKRRLSPEGRKRIAEAARRRWAAKRAADAGQGTAKQAGAKKATKRGAKSAAKSE